MNTQLKITKIGNSAGVILPKALLDHLDAAVGDRLEVVRTSRGIEIRMAIPDCDNQAPIEEQLAAAREVMERRHHVMMALANEIMDEDRELLAKLAKR